MLTQVAAFLWFSVAILLSACSSLARPPQASPVVPVGEPEIVDVGPSTEVVNNCGPGGGTVIKHPSRTMISSHAVEWQVAGQAGIGTHIGDGVIPGGVNLRAGLEGRYVSAITEGVQKGIDWELPAEPNTVVEYTLMWREVWQPGYIDVRAGGQNFKIDVRYRTDIRSEIMGKRAQPCGEDQTITSPTTSRSSPTTGPEPQSPTPIPQQPTAVQTYLPTVSIEVLGVWEYEGHRPPFPAPANSEQVIVAHGDIDDSGTCHIKEFGPGEPIRGLGNGTFKLVRITGTREQIKVAEAQIQKGAAEHAIGGTCPWLE